MYIDILIIVAGVILDQLSKALVLRTLSDVNTLPIIPNVFHFTYVENTGAAFSMFSGIQWLILILTLAFTVFLCYLLYIFPKSRRYRMINVALSLIISGAIVNILDRLHYGHVIDFIDVRLINFAIFNFADVLVVTGTVLLIFCLYKNKNSRVSVPVIHTKLTRLPEREKDAPEKPKPRQSPTRTIENFNALRQDFEQEKRPVKKEKNRYEQASDAYEASVKRQREQSKRGR